MERGRDGHPAKHLDGKIEMLNFEGIEFKPPELSAVLGADGIVTLSITAYEYFDPDTSYRIEIPLTRETAR